MKKITPKFASKLLIAVFETDEQEFDSGATALNPTQRRTMGGVPSLYHEITSWPEGGHALDYGCGVPANAEVVQQFMESKGVTCHSWDRNHTKFNAETEEFLRKQKADIATCSLVLNVVKEESARLNIFRNIHKSLKPGGTAYFSVWVGSPADRQKGARPTGRGRFQNFFTVDQYLEEGEQVFSSGGIIRQKSEIAFFYLDK